MVFKTKRAGAKRVRISCDECWIVTRDGPKHPATTLLIGENPEAWMAKHQHNLTLAEARIEHHALMHPRETALLRQLDRR